jgi:hypothetical protein
MAWALEFNGVDQRLELSASDSRAGDFRIEIDDFGYISIPSGGDLGGVIGDLNSYNNFSPQYRSDTGEWQFRISNTSYTIPVSSIPINTNTSQYIFERVGNQATFTLDGVSHTQTVTTSNFTTGVIGTLNRTGSPSSHYGNIRAGNIRYYNSSDVLIRDFDMSLSDHGNTGQQPIVDDNSGVLFDDLTGVGFDGTGDYWVDLDGGAINTASLSDSQNQTDSINANAIISAQALNIQIQIDNIIGSAQLSSSITDSQGQSDNTSGSVAISSAISDTQSQLENIIGTVLLSADISDTQNQTDSLIGAVGDVVFGDIADVQSQVDNISSSAIISGSAIDFQSQASSINAGVTVSALVSDNQSQIDNITGFVSGGPITGSVTDEQGQLDQLSGLIVIAANLTDSQGQIDSINERTIVYDGGYTARIDGQTFYSATIDAQTYYTAKIG